MFSVLYVDDEPPLLTLGKEFLERSGTIRLDTALSAAEALGKLEGATYDGIISDYLMPMMDGITFLKQVRARYGDLPFILFTGKGREEVVIAALNSGADYYLQKGGEPLALYTELEHKITLAIQQRQTHIALRASQNQLEEMNARLEEELEEKTAAETSLVESRNYLDAIINAMGDPVFVKDRQHRWVLMNDAMCRFIGYPRGELIGKSDHDFFPKEQAGIFWQKDELVFGSGMENVNEEEITDAGGAVHTIVTKKTLYTDVAGATFIVGMIRDITARKRAEDALRLKLDAVLSPEVELTEEEFGNIINSPALQSMMDDFYDLVGMGIGIIDLKGNVLVGTGWQDICTQFFRVNPETQRNCIESDLTLTTGLKEGEIRDYKCKNNMWDIVTPIFIGDKHIGNIFFGQFLYDDEEADYEGFAAMAERYGFDREKFLAALHRVPRFSRQRVRSLMRFYAKLAHQISELSYSNIKLAKLLAQQK